jgi:hypothetical protein
VIADPVAINRYIVAALADLESRGFEVPTLIEAQIDDEGVLSFSIQGHCPEESVARPALAVLREVWMPVGERVWRRSEYAYDLIDHPADRRRAWHMHAVDQARSVLGAAAHEHCEERLGRPACEHYRGYELSNIHVGIALIDAAWTEPGPLGCETLVCL